MFLPDTNAFSKFLRQKRSVLSRRMEGARSNGELVLSSIVLEELEYGSEKARLTGRNTGRAMGGSEFGEG